MALSCSQDAVIRTKAKSALRDFSKNVNRTHDLPDDLAAAVTAVELIQNWTDRVQASVVEAKVGAVAEQLIRNAKTRLVGLEPLLGCKFATSTRFTDKTEIIQVLPHRAGANAGLREGDVVSEINGKAVPTKERFRTEVSRYHPGDVLTFHVHRGNSYTHSSCPLLIRS
jgi:S1-C subfamily serine protease